ncbi:tyrosinase family protein [Mesorhizobium sp. M0999]|uniref:tyrosinase family protein n=1 Tax=Mesorhizobium sp. M0999 TaxID=2957045 RepID=UPI003337B1ED
MINRRELMIGTAALGAAGVATATRAADNLVRFPLHVFAQDSAKMASFRRGVQVMRSRPPSDPTSWFFQAAMHAVSQEAFEDAALADPKILEVRDFFNQCPHFGAPSAEFLPWHRAYLYFFERILRAASGNPALTLPYWDYTNEAQRTFPREFARFVVPGSGGNEVNPLYHRNRQLSFVAGTHALTAEAVAIDDLMLEPNFFGRTDEDGFGGGLSDADAGTKGLIERRPHDQLHFAIGGQIGDVSGAMADVPRAAFDPIFWVHHSNIDRIWAIWSGDPGRKWGALPPASYFDTDAWIFFDGDGTQKTVQRRIYFNHRDLGYVYADEDLSKAPLALPPATGGDPGVFDVAARSRAVIAATRALVFSSTEPTVVNFSDTAKFDSADTTLQDAMASDVDDILVAFNGLSFRNAPLSGFDVYVNPGPADTRASSPYLGTLGLFGLDHSHHGPAGSQSFNVTERLRAMPKTSDLIIKIVPFDLLTSDSEGPLRNGVELEVASIELQAVSR